LKQLEASRDAAWAASRDAACAAAWDAGDAAYAATCDAQKDQLVLMILEGIESGDVC
jgi:hypothetical protein